MFNSLRKKRSHLLLSVLLVLFIVFDISIYNITITIFMFEFRGPCLDSPGTCSEHGGGERDPLCSAVRDELGGITAFYKQLNSSVLIL